MTRLSIIIPVLNSHEIVRRQLLHFKSMDLPDSVEIIFVDDGSDPPIEDTVGISNFRIVRTNDKREWTWALARNRGAKEAKGEYFLMCDLDYIIPREAIDKALAFNGAKMRFRRQFAILDENGKFVQEKETLIKYGLSPERYKNRKFDMPPHPNNFVMRKDVYWDLGGFPEDRVGRPYPQGEDTIFKRKWIEAVKAGKYVDDDPRCRPMLYMFPNGQFCGDVDYNPFNLFHTLSRRTSKNAYAREVVKKQTLSVIIPARNEEFLERTINSVLDNAECDTEVIAILDGYWADPPIPDRKKVTLIHHVDSVGQRAATNEGARLSRSKYIMKLDAHCIVDKGFDTKLITPYELGEIDMRTTSIPRMYNLHAFNWTCCGKSYYQADKPDKCPVCGKNEFGREIVWKPRWGRMTECWRFDKDMHFQYWDRGRKQQSGELCDVMSSIGACFFMPKSFFEEIDGLDEKHGSWGQFGTEIACKSWLIGGRHIVNKRTWFSHMFRVKHRYFGFPYAISGRQQDRAKEYSKDLWLNNKWEKQVRNLDWIIKHFDYPPNWEKNG